MSHHHIAVQLANCSILQDQRQRSFCLRSRSSSLEQLVDKAGLSADENDQPWMTSLYSTSPVIVVVVVYVQIRWRVTSGPSSRVPTVGAWRRLGPVMATTTVWTCPMSWIVTTVQCWAAAAGAMSSRAPWFTSAFTKPGCATATLTARITVMKISPVVSAAVYLSIHWWRGVVAMRCVESTKLLYGGPG